MYTCLPGTGQCLHASVAFCDYARTQDKPVKVFAPFVEPNAEGIWIERSQDIVNILQDTHREVLVAVIARWPLSTRTAEAARWREAAESVAFDATVLASGIREPALDPGQAAVVTAWRLGSGGWLGPVLECGVEVEGVSRLSGSPPLPRGWTRN